MRHLYAFLFLLFAAISGYAQQFVPNGSAVSTAPTSANATCFRLTPSQENQRGAVWNTMPINLTQSFDFFTQLYFGALPGGADGIAFVLQSEGTSYLGNTGAGLGYHRFPSDIPGPVPSFIVEFDTYQNGFIAGQNVGDPAGDHVGFMSMSNAYHTSSTTLKAPEEIGVFIEDNQYHDTRFTWDAVTKTLRVVITLSTAPLVVKEFIYSGDIVANIFNGNPIVYWGFTASTGGFISSPQQSEQKVCFVTPPPPGSCGQLRTQTPGGWGAKPAGNNPGTYLYNNFDAAFPGGLVVGVVPNFHIRLTSEQAITNFLPSGGQAKKLTQNYTDPSNLKNVLAGHLVALTLSVRFDQTDPSFGAAGITLGDMIIGSGAFSGWTVSAFLSEANKVLGGAASPYTVQQVLETATSINENYVDGKRNNGYLVCPSTTAPRLLPAPAEFTMMQQSPDYSVGPNPSTGAFTLRMAAARSQNAQVIITDANGANIERRIVRMNEQAQMLKFDLSGQANGVYLVRILAGNKTVTHKVIIHR